MHVFLLILAIVFLPVLGSLACRALWLLGECLKQWKWRK